MPADATLPVLGVDSVVEVHDGFRFGCWRNAFIVSQTQPPTAADVERTRVEVKALAARRSKKLVVIIHVSDGVPPPDAAARAAIGRLVDELESIASKSCLVLEGSSFWSAMARSVQAGIELGTRSKNRLESCASLNEAIEKIKPYVEGNPSDVELFVAAGAVGAARSSALQLGA